MTHQQHPITPPPELVQKWEEEWHHSHFKHGNVDLSPYLAIRAAQWGADQELEACEEWLAIQLNCTGQEHLVPCLRDHRRPKPPSLKEQALAAQQRMWNGSSTHEDWRLIRRALEALPDE